MVAQIKADARSAASKPDTTGKKELQKDAAVDGKELLDDQTTAAAVVHADQAEMVAARVADGAILPTDAPTDGIGLIAQTTVTPTDPPADTSTTSTTGTTPAPEVEEPAGWNPWVVGGAALLGIGAVVAIANDDDDDDPPAPAPAPEPPAPEPPAPEPPPPPPPPANVAPTSVDAAIVTESGTAASTVIPPSTFQFVDTDGGALTSVRIDAITPTPIVDEDEPNLAIDPAADGHGYELVTVEGGITWDAAQAAALAKGGHLAILETGAESVFLEDNFDLGANAGGINTDGTWVGASQTGGATPGDGWTWVDGTTVLAADSTLWNDPAPADFTVDGDTFGTEDGEAQFAAIYDEPAGATPEGNVYDFGLASDVQTRYVIEYDTPNAGPLTLDGAPVAAGTVIAVADLETLAWNSVFNTGGTVSFSVNDGTDFSATPNTLTITDPLVATSLATLIEDPNSNTLA